jgi:hypothetical protein
MLQAAPCFDKAKKDGVFITLLNADYRTLGPQNKFCFLSEIVT